MSRFLRIIILIIIVLLLIFFGFRCSQNVPKNSKETANFIKKSQQPVETTANIDTDETTKTNSDTDTVVIETTEEPSTESNKEEEQESNETTNNENTTENVAKSAAKNATGNNPETKGETTIESSQPEADKTQSNDKNNDNPTKKASDTTTNTVDEAKNNDTNKIDTTTITKGASIILKGVSFASGSDKLIESSITTLNEIAKTLKEKSTLQIEIAGYTDNKGNDSVNTKLSQLRANQVKTHLVSQKVDASRISTKGYGASSPIASNDTKTGREKNRRVEIHVK